MPRSVMKGRDMGEDSTRRLLGSPDDFLEKLSGRLPGSRLEDFLEVIWKTSGKSSGRHPGSRLTHYISDD
ncbi:hypothetical protein F2Q70_00037069 [Brassica cretica]|uniref:Uncharacterized protein n=1 Tax=Brassica cretica TaxID=69181 RepID=A0A8S9JUY9_BRACR|nr:hypothetical protein F2Q70_00037069 [Brassica cretica]